MSSIFEFGRNKALETRILSDFRLTDVFNLLQTKVRLKHGTREVDVVHWLLRMQDVVGR